MPLIPACLLAFIACVISYNCGQEIITEQNFACVFNAISAAVRTSRFDGLKKSGWKASNIDEAAVFLAHVFHETDGLKTVREYCAPGCGTNYAGSWCSIKGKPNKLYYGRVHPCNRPFIYRFEFCLRYFCIIDTPWLALWDSILHNTIPAYIIVIFNIVLLIRVLYQRFIIRQRIDWRNYKRLASQTLSISALYLFLHLPPLTLYTLYSFGLSRSIASDYYFDSLFFDNGIILFTPFVCVGSLPDLRTKIKNAFYFWRNRSAVAPDQMMMNRMQNIQTVIHR
ncbi:unnamed protein product [Adineta ricciae]|uniref:Uncharacterized protein n=1 Tax=Adineta ricciae TaxID=249248 RepID=A0A815M817_ADIRI|nr:unnamed protein product [Adineta ricciae]